MNEIFEQRKLDGRAEIAAAMDVLMRHLNDEEAVAPWLMLGVPDDMDHSAFPKDPEAKRKQYLDYVKDMDDEEWDGQVRLFSSIVKDQCYEGPRCKMTYRKGAFF